MKTLSIGLLIFATAIGHAQQTITIPAQKITLPASAPALPSGLTWDGTAFQIRGKGAPSFGSPVTFTVAAASAVGIGKSITVQVPYPAVNALQNGPIVWPTYDPGEAFRPFAFVSAPGVVTVRIQNVSLAPANLPAGTWILKVL